MSQENQNDHGPVSAEDARLYDTWDPRVVEARKPRVAAYEALRIALPSFAGEAND
jgi:hypothetical protein